MQRSGFLVFAVSGGVAALVISIFFALPAEAATFTCPGTTQISVGARYAWNEALGWIDFGTAAGCVRVGPPEMRGYAFSSAGEVVLNCADWGLCSTSSFKVLRDSSTNDLSGYAWNDSIGWLSFNCDQTPVGGANTCSTSNYKAWVDTDAGKFRGWAWSETVGWISFNCAEPNLCLTSAYSMGLSTFDRSGELTSSVFDTGIGDGAAYNVILWQGTLPTGGAVRFQFASSQCSNGATNPPACTSGTWNFLGPDGSPSTVYEPVGPNVPAAISRAYHNNHRYYRYKVFLLTTGSATPRVDNIIVNWSP